MRDECDVILPFENRLREGVQRERASEELGTARCPICDAPLRMRVDCHGPRFVCACVDRDLRAAG
jgi:hypothetical protein